MGHVHLETLSQGRGAHEFDNLSLSDATTVEILIENRQDFDKFYLTKKYNSYCGSALFHENIEVLYADLDILIENMYNNQKITNTQYKIITCMMLGYSQKDIAELIFSYKSKKETDDWKKEFKNNKESVGRMFKSTCKKIARENILNWHNFAIHKYKNIAHKQCASCGRMFPATQEFFSPNKDSKDGFYSMCKECNSINH